MSAGTGIRRRTRRHNAEAQWRAYHKRQRAIYRTLLEEPETTETVYDPYHGGDPGSSDYEAEIEYCEVGIGIKEQYKNNCLVWEARS